MKAMSMTPVRSWVRRSVLDFIGDRRGIAATEFAFIVPIMLVIFFGTVEFSQGVAVNRKVTLVAHTLADLTGQSTSVADSDLTNFYSAGCSIVTPYNPAPIVATVSELYVDPTTLQARVQWSKSATVSSTCSVTLGAGRTVSSPVTIPSQLQVGGTYLIFSEVGYLYIPTIGYVMAPTGVNLTDNDFTRPRQSTCVFYPPPTNTTTPCPTL
jgi:Flp pilus assembly protein TadG